MRYLIAFCILVPLVACSDNSRDASNQDSEVDNDIQDSSSAESDSSTAYDGNSNIQDSSSPDSQKDSVNDLDADIKASGSLDSEIIDSDIVDADLNDSEIENAQETEEEIITDEPTRIYLDSCESHYANNKRCTEEKCTTLGVNYNYTKGCPGKEHAHRYLCESANPPKDDFKYMLICICACADIE